jgi:predicted enzyme related to lactoylglutathione lyase
VATHRVSELIPFVRVADVDRSIAFYALLGFEVTETFRPRGCLQWAALESAGAQLMLARESAAIDPEQQRVLFYLYAEDLDALRERLLAGGVEAGAIVDGSPGPAREMRLSDPDGYCLMVAEIE